MKLFSKVIIVALFAVVAALNASAQVTPASPQPTPASSGGVFPESKIAVIDTEAFADPKSGIGKLVAAFDVVNREFKTRGDEIQRLKDQYDKLVKDIEALRNAPSQETTIVTKTDQAKTLENDIKRKAEDAQRDYEKRLRAATEPIYKDISTALQAYASQRGITLVLDVSKLGEVMFVVNNSIDLTPGFIADYNQRNPTPAKP